MNLISPIVAISSISIDRTISCPLVDVQMCWIECISPSSSCTVGTCNNDFDGSTIDSFLIVYAIECWLIIIEIARISSRIPIMTSIVGVRHRSDSWSDSWSYSIIEYKRDGLSGRNISCIVCRIKTCHEWGFVVYDTRQWYKRVSSICCSCEDIQ